MEDKTKYLIQLEKLLSKASAESVTIMSKRLWKLQLIIDLCAVTQFFNEELAKIKECYNLDIDRDVNYEEWASNEKNQRGNAVPVITRLMHECGIRI